MRFHSILGPHFWIRQQLANMKFLMCMFFLAVALSTVSAGYIRSGWASPSYSHSAPIVYSRPYVSHGGGWNSGYGGWNSGGWNGGWNNGWNSGWKGW